MLSSNVMCLLLVSLQEDPTFALIPCHKCISISNWLWIMFCGSVKSKTTIHYSNQAKSASKHLFDAKSKISMFINVVK